MPAVTGHAACGGGHHPRPEKRRRTPRHGLTEDRRVFEQHRRFKSSDKEQKARRMIPPKIRQQRHVPERLCAVVAREFKQSQPALALFDEFLPLTSYSRDFSSRLLDVARGDGGASWEMRRLAALMLENQVLKLAPDNAEEFDLLFVRLGLKAATGKGHEIDRSVLREGYTTTHFCRFVVEFRQKLGRLERVHARLCGGRTSPGALRDFVNLSKRECKISIARYLFTPEEVVRRIVGQLRISRGVPDLDHREPLFVGREMERAVDLLPDYEAAILKRLCDAPLIYWVAKTTGSELNSLVEYPLTTVVLVVKPPGSSVEFEIKRAGKRRGPVLSVVYERGGYTVPPPHRLDGGSMLSFLRHEARSGAMFANAYRQAHGSEPPMSVMVARSSIFGVPRNGGDVENILEYFTTPERFGSGFQDMRAAMKDCVYAFNEHDEIAIKLPGDFALAVQFIHHARPGQAILSNTSSFRLDKVAYYLSEGGPEFYYKQGLRTDYTNEDARRLADDVLEEALGVYAPPAVPYRSHRQYVSAALSTEANRARADHVFLDAMRQLGKYWGTLLALRGYSWGESFVARNVGLKSYWHNGQWKVRLVFMDHDCLNVADKSDRDFHSVHAYNGIATDARYIGGDLIYTRERQTAVYFLREIYRAPQPVYDEGKQVFYDAIRTAYKATHVAMLTNPQLGKFFHKVFLERLRDWDKVVTSYFAMRSNGADVEAWKEKVRRTLKEKGYAKHVIEGHLKTIESHSAFLTNQRFLY